MTSRQKLEKLKLMVGNSTLVVRLCEDSPLGYSHIDKLHDNKEFMEENGLVLHSPMYEIYNNEMDHIEISGSIVHYNKAGSEFFIALGNFSPLVES